MSKKPNSMVVSTADLRFLLESFENLEAELEQLMFDNTWYVADSVDFVKGALQLLRGLLGIEEPENDEESNLD